MYYVCCIYVYSANIATLSCSRSKRDAVVADKEAGGGGCRACRAAAWWGGPVCLSGRRPGVAIPGRISMSLQAIKSVHEPVVVGLAGMVQVQPATGLAGMDLAEICKEYAVICKNMDKICIYIYIYTLY